VQGPGWPWVFFLNVPLGLLLIVLVLAWVPSDAPPPSRARADLGGAGTLTGGLMAVVLGVHDSISSGWGSLATLVPLAGGLGLLAGFVIHEGRTTAPLIPLVTLRKRSLLFANLTAGLLWASFLGLIYEATLFVQQGQHYSPLAAGSSTIPIAVLSLVFSAKIAPRLIDRLGAARTLGAGMAIQGAGLLMLARVPDHVSYVVDLLPAYAVIGIGLGLGLAQVAMQIAAFTGVSRDEAGLAGGAIETSREMGGAIGLAVLVSVAVGGAIDNTQAFHRSVIVAAVFAGASAIIALALLRPTERTSRATSHVAAPAEAAAEA